MTTQQGNNKIIKKDIEITPHQRSHFFPLYYSHQAAIESLRIKVLFFWLHHRSQLPSHTQSRVQTFKVSYLTYVPLQRV